MLLKAVAALTLLIPSISSQQFKERPQHYEFLGLSDGCFAAVNTTFQTCSELLGYEVDYQSGSRAELEQSELEELCVDGCRKELESFKAKIASACSKDKVVRNNIAYPGTYMIDHYILGYTLACRKDPATKQFCDILIAETGKTENDTLSCSECILGSWKVELESPFEYDEEYASDFASRTSSCKATGYNFVTPTSYALNSSTPAPSPAMVCDKPYMVKEGDTCASIAEHNGISTDGLISLNSLGQGCQGLRSGRTVCLPEACAVHKIVKTDNCKVLASSYNTTEYRLLAWNPMLNPKCTNIADHVGWYMCVSSPGGEVAAPTGHAATTAVPVPTNAHQESQKNCAKWYTVNKGDDCAQISVANGINLVDFYFLNPEIDKNCTNLWLNTAYCVEAVGNIATYTGYPVSVPSTSFTRPTPTSTPDSTPSTISIPVYPLASGTVEGCAKYSRGLLGGNEEDRKVINSCRFRASSNRVSVDDLLKWNPSLSRDICVFSSKVKYCVVKDEKDLRTMSRTPFSSYCQRYTKEDIVAGTDPSCNCYDYQEGGLDDDQETCAGIAESYKFSLEYLISMNPWLTIKDCDKNLNAGLKTEKDRKYFCIRAGGTSESASKATASTTQVGTATKQTSNTKATTTTKGAASSTAPTTKARSTTSKTSDTKTTTTTAGNASPPAPTQSGVAKNCKKWHTVVKDDGCWAISNSYGVPLEEFYKLNPDVGSDCKNLWLGYAVCVGT